MVSKNRFGIPAELQDHESVADSASTRINGITIGTSPGVGQARGSSGNETDSTNNVAPVVTLDNDGNTNFQGTKGSSINALYKNAPNCTRQPITGKASDTSNTIGLDPSSRGGMSMSNGSFLQT